MSVPDRAPAAHASPDAAEVRAELARVLASPLSARADRAAGYDPGADPIVRVEARRIRAKLERYYGIQGRDAAIRIGFPGPGYVPAFTRLRPPVQTAPAPRTR
jgi:hypothetical protein